MKKHFLLIILSLVISSCSINKRLTTKIFEGNYIDGTAKYSFYKGKNDSIIMNGKFEFLKANQLERGQYSQNLKVGTWKYDFENKDYKITFYGNYIDDFKNGIWTFSFIENGVSENYFLEFENDTLIGKIDWSGLKGEFDENGKFIGVWEIKSNSEKYDATFKDNILILLENKRLNGILLSVYRPETYSIDFSKLSSENNPIIRKEYDLDWNFRLMSGEFDVDKIYDINRVKLNGISTTYLEKEIFFNNFFESITGRLNEKIFDYTNWTFFKSLELKNNPELLYSNIQTVIPKKDVLQNKFNFDKLINNRLVDEKPLFKDGNDNFIPFIKDNYYNFDEVSGKVVIEFVIDKQGSINILSIKTTGDFSESEIRRVLSSSPKWTPGKKDGKLTEVKIILPINVVRN